MSIDLLRELISYDHATGEFTWKPRPLSMFDNVRLFRGWNTQFANKKALTAVCDGYPSGSICRKGYRAHRVAWALYNGEWPNGFVDHINRVKHDNRITNLRLVGYHENAFNRTVRTSNTTGANGVSFDKQYNKYRSFITAYGKQTYLGSFATFDEALTVREAAEKTYWPDGARTPDHLAVQS